MSKQHGWIFVAILTLTSWFVSAGEIVFHPLSHGPENTEKDPGDWMTVVLGKSAHFGENRTRMYATRESVTGEVALRLQVPKGARGMIEMEDDAYPENSAGITFYIKASAPMQFVFNEDKTAFRFEVGADWKKIDIPWEKLGTTREKRQISYFFKLSLDKPAEKDGWYIIDRIGTEVPEFNPKPAIKVLDGPDKTISTSELVGNAEALKSTVERLKSKKPFKIVALGDSISWGAQIDRGNRFLRKLKGPKRNPYLYFGCLARELETHFKYKGITPLMRAKPSTAATQGARVLGRVLGEMAKDDLLIIQYGTNDLHRKPDVDKWLANVKVLVDKAKAKTSQIILISPTSGPKFFRFAKEIREKFPAFAKAQGVAWFDLCHWSFYRGEKYAYAYLANPHHPEMAGHQQMAELLKTLFTGRHFDWPEYVKEP